MKKKAKRPYVLKARAKHLDETRTRIVEAMVQLHQEVGPAKTTVTAIAELAGVERLTVYRHFRGEAAMLDACSHLYFERNPPPHPGLWADESDPLRRTRRALLEIYDFFSRTAPMFEKVYRDADESVALKKIMNGFDAHLRSMADDLAAAWPSGSKRARRAVILRHATKFSTWQSLTAEAVDNAEKAALIIEWLWAGAQSTPER